MKILHHLFSPMDVFGLLYHRFDENIPYFDSTPKV